MLQIKENITKLCMNYEQEIILLRKYFMSKKQDNDVKTN